MAKPTPQDINEPFSDELLAALGEGPEESPQEVVETPREAIEAPSEVPEAPVETVEEPVQEVIDDGEPTPSTNGSEPDGNIEVEDTYEKRYKDLQSFTTKSNEELRQQMAQQQELINRLLLGQTPQTEPVQEVNTQVTPKQLSEGVKNSPEESLAWVANNRPDLVGNTLSLIAQHHGTEAAVQASTEYQMFLAQQQQMQLQQHRQEIEERQLQSEMPGVIQNGIGMILDQVADHYGDDFKRLAPKLQEALAKLDKIPDPSPDGIRNLVEREFLAIMKEDLVNKRIEEAKKPVKLKPGESVDAGTPGQAPALSGEDEFVDELVKAYQDSQYK